MPFSSEELFWKGFDPEELRSLLPSVLPEWVGFLGGIAGLVTLASSSEPGALEEAASCGYGEDGFFYPFLARGSMVRERLELSISPFFQEKSSSLELFAEESLGCLLGPIRSGENLLGFFLVEIGRRPEEKEIFLLGLLCQRLASAWEVQKKETRKGQSLGSDSPSNSVLGELLFGLAGGRESNLVRFRENRVLRVSGPASSGKKTLAKWVHKKDSQDKPLIFVSVLPEQIPKLERALADWEKMAQSGTIVLEKVEEYSLNQQRILYEYSQRKGAKCRLIFLENNEKNRTEEFVYFLSLLAVNSIELPVWKSWKEEDRRSAILPIFSEVIEMHGRPDLRLGRDALEVLAGGSSYLNLEDVRNAIEEAVLNSGTTEIHTSELKKEGARAVSLPDPEDLDLRKAVEAMERQKILLADKLFGGNQIRMAKALGISRGSLQYKLRNLGLG